MANNAIKENKITSIGKLKPKTQSVDTKYSNSMDVLTRLSYIINIENKAVKYMFSPTANLLAGKAIIFETVVSKSGIKWIRNIDLAIDIQTLTSDGTAS